MHGYLRSASDWDTMIERFEADGWPASHLSAYSYNTSQSNVKSAEEEVQPRPTTATTPPTETACISQLELMQDETVYGEVRDFVE